eukprot:TRINITY_DN11748_c0_g1_i2.p2 TRINITY_DN11748_c0_g1~~TRINITY_DN11748_c0_g1_i2.p2  ORF type:complete len:112 (+),score=5.01 TRINITY_DN11748_c0_g1_i2:460-795(+)
MILPSHVGCSWSTPRARKHFHEQHRLFRKNFFSFCWVLATAGFEPGTTARGDQPLCRLPTKLTPPPPYSALIPLLPKHTIQAPPSCLAPFSCRKSTLDKWYHTTLSVMRKV